MDPPLPSGRGASGTSPATTPSSDRAARRAAGRRAGLLALRVEWLLTAATLTSLLLAWYVVARFGLVSDLFVPHPAAVWAAFTDILLDGYRGATLLRHLGDSLYRVVVGFLLAVVTAVPLGLAIGYSSKVQAVFDPIIEFYRPLPPLAYYTLLVIWLGIENESKIALLYFAAFPPLSVSAMAGVRGVASERIQGAQSLGASRWQVFRYVIFPSCLPDIFTGMRVSIGFTYTTLVAAEMVAATSGIGWMVLDASKFLRSDVIFMGNIVMGLTGIGLDRLIRTAEGRVVPWKGRA
ncbi:MAG: taurine ABC transporter permease [Candidatus Rokuibacteriota bacterium]|nr:MAG: taurine ABC transporter permease [Candidatus Rokubacteria bacterium]